MKLTLLTAPTAQPVTTTEAKTHARIFGSSDDAYVDGLIESAVIKWTEETGFHLTQAEYQLDVTSPRLLHSKLVLPLRPVLEIEAVNSLTVEIDYSVTTDLSTGVATITFLTGVPASITVTFKVGFANPTDDDPQQAPALTKHAIKTLVAHWFNNREAYQDGSEVKTVPATYQSIVNNYRLA